MEFKEAFEKLIGHEGGYSSDPKDPGNWTGGRTGVGIVKGTKFGIAANTYPSEDIKGLTIERARLIYRRDFWDHLFLDKLPANVRFDLFDAAVNSGVKQASKFLQRAAGVTDDGVIGPATLAAANAIDAQLLDKRLSGYRLKYMAELRTWPTYARGWATRIADNLISD